MATIHDKLRHQREARKRLRELMDTNATADVASLFESARTRMSEAIREQELNVLRHKAWGRQREHDSAAEKLTQLVGDRDAFNALAHALRAFNPSWVELFDSFLTYMDMQVDDTEHAASLYQ